jgi:hypothetical protein
MAIFSFRPPASGRRRNGPTPPPDWDITRPADFADAAYGDGEEFSESGFSPSTFSESSLPADLDARPRAVATADASAVDIPLDLASPAPLETGPDSAFVADPVTGEVTPNPGFAKALTARPQNDEPLGAGWYISSWDLLQGCDVIEGAPVDLLPAEWQRKGSRP